MGNQRDSHSSRVEDRMQPDTATMDMETGRYACACMAPAEDIGGKTTTKPVTIFTHILEERKQHSARMPDCSWHRRAQCITTSATIHPLKLSTRYGNSTPVFQSIAKGTHAIARGRNTSSSAPFLSIIRCARRNVNVVQGPWQG